MILDEILNNTDKFKKGLLNELLISGNLSTKGFKTKVLNDHNPNFDILINKDNMINYVECKLDCLSDKTNNLYFEYWNFTFNRPTGINNSNLKTIYCHTFKYLGKWYYLINYRLNIINTLKLILKEQPNKILPFNNTYFINSKLVGDKAYLVNIPTFLKYYSGNIIKLKFALRWY